ncbi:MAG: helix-turn-helix domain-containing protein [Bacilli bacterium]
MEQLRNEEIQALERLSDHSHGIVAKWLFLIKEQAELTQKMSFSDLSSLKMAVQEHPELSHVLETIQQLSTEIISTHSLSNREPFNAERAQDDDKTEEPEYLSTLEVAKFLDISPQMVRRYCQDGSIKAWRTLGDRGEWRIDMAQYRDHPKLTAMLDARSRRNRNLISAIDDLFEQKNVNHD